MIAYPDVDVNLGIDAKRGNRLWKVIKAIARNRGCKVEDVPDSEWSRIRWLIESNAKLEALTDAEFAELVAEADNHIEWERYQEARDAYAEEIHA